MPSVADSFGSSARSMNRSAAVFFRFAASPSGFFWAVARLRGLRFSVLFPEAAFPVAARSFPVGAVAAFAFSPELRTALRFSESAPGFAVPAFPPELRTVLRFPGSASGFSAFAFPPAL
jgi:hypothetical protein